MRRCGESPRGLIGLGLIGMVAGVPARGSDFEMGDVFVAITKGQYQRYSSGGVLIETLSTGYSGTSTGCAVDVALDLYTTDFMANRVVKLGRAAPHPVCLPGGDATRALLHGRRGGPAATAAPLLPGARGLPQRRRGYRPPILSPRHLGERGDRARAGSNPRRVGRGAAPLTIRGLATILTSQV